MIRVSVRFNMFGVKVIKQGIVPCKLLIAASEIAVFVGWNITYATPIFCQAHTVVHRVVNSIGPRSRTRRELTSTGSYVLCDRCCSTVRPLLLRSAGKDGRNYSFPTSLRNPMK